MTRRKVFSRHKLLILFTLVLIGVGMAAFLWLRQPSQVETELFIPIKSDAASQSIKVIRPRSAGLDVRVKGSRAAIAALSQQSLRYPLHIPATGGSVQTFPVETDKITLPKGIVIVQVHPQTITTRIEKRIEKSLPLEAVLKGAPAMGFVVATAVIKPQRIRVTGPESILAGMTAIPIMPVDITGLSANFKKRVALDLPDENEPVESKPIILEVSFKKSTKVTTLFGIRIQGKGAEKPYRISPPTIDLIVEGPDQVVGNNLTADPQFDVYVDLTGLDAGIFVRRAVILLPLNTILIKAKPEVFTVHYGSENNQGG